MVIPFCPYSIETLKGIGAVCLLLLRIPGDTMGFALGINTDV